MLLTVGEQEGSSEKSERVSTGLRRAGSGKVEDWRGCIAGDMVTEIRSKIGPGRTQGFISGRLSLPGSQRHSELTRAWPGQQTTNCVCFGSQTEPF